MTPDNQTWQVLASAIFAQCGKRIEPASASPVSGGCIHTALKVESSDGPVFLKLNDASMADTFAAEQAGLEALAVTDTLKVPAPLGHGVAKSCAWLAMEWLELSTSAGRDANRALGLGLAGLHAAPGRQFGFKADNVIGANPQPNQWSDNWSSFVRDHRIRFQLELAASNGFGGELQTAGKELLSRLDDWSTVHIQPALQHGDLWGGNWGVLQTGEPVVFDPAFFYGDPEADIAMTRLFGGGYLGQAMTLLRKLLQ